ncbi:MAG: hypothetical protein ACRDS0_06855 [Pseudonocardiaceae bacterium]
MPAPASQPTNDRWCDIEGNHISLFCRVEQVASSPEPGCLPSRLHQQGHVVGRGLDSLFVRFSDNALISVPPELLRLLSDRPGEW